MQRHRTDLIALIFGVAFAFVGAGFIVDEATNRDFDPGWIVAIGLVTLGVIALATTLFQRPPEVEVEVEDE
jgi:hypothetical protein